MNATAVYTVDTTKLVKNLTDRYYWFQMEAGRHIALGRYMRGSYAQQYNKLRRAYYALKDINPELAKHTWINARKSTNDQFATRGLGCTILVDPCARPDAFSRPQEEAIYETNDLIEAFSDWKPVIEKPYAGTDYRAIQKSEVDPLLPKLTIEQHEDDLRKLIDKALDNGWMIASKNKYLATLLEIARYADLMLPLDKISDYEYYTSYGHTIHAWEVLEETTNLGYEFIKHSYQARRAKIYLSKAGRSIYLGDEEHNRTLRKALKGAQARFYNFSDTIYDPYEMDELKDRHEVALEAYGTDARDNTLGIEHGGWRMNRTATKGIGSKDPIQMLFQAPQDSFYSLLRLRKHKFPKTSIHSLMSPTAYKTVDGRKAIVANDNIDMFVRSLAMCRWHDEAHHTNYFEIASMAMLAKYEFADKVIDLATIACQAMPNSLDQFNVNMFWKEDRILKQHNWGYYHWKAAA